jgi:HEPN domain-containing protein
MFDLFVRPEMTHRQLPPETTLSMFQIVWAEHGTPPQVRLGNEVRALALMEAKSIGQMKIGDNFVPDAETRVRAIRLPEEEEGKHAHFTAVRMLNKWFLAFDFRYQKEVARAHTSAAYEFLQAAESSLASGNRRAFVDNAHSCAELLVKADLLLLNLVGEGRIHHTEIRDRAAKLLHLEDLHETLQTLSQLRLSARYFLSPFDTPDQDLERIRTSLNEFWNVAQARGAKLEPSPRTS